MNPGFQACTPNLIVACFLCYNNLLAFLSMLEEKDSRLGWTVVGDQRKIGKRRGLQHGEWQPLANAGTLVSSKDVLREA